MPRQSDGQKIDDLEKLVATLTERLDQVRKEVERLRGDQDGTAKGVHDLNTSWAVIDEQLGELRRGWEEASRWRWSFASSAAIAILSAGLALLGQWLVNHLMKK